ncbi:MAG: hybrid sensor histidine kinase/response regulator, partial [Acidobacteria bacterium]
MTAFRDLPIRRKLLLIIMLTSGASLLLACALLVSYQQVHQRHVMTERLAMLSRVLGGNSTAALAFQDRRSAEEILATLRVFEHIIGA